MKNPEENEFILYTANRARRLLDLHEAMVHQMIQYLVPHSSPTKVKRNPHIVKEVKSTAQNDKPCQ